MSVTCPGCADLHDQLRELTAQLDRYRWYRTLGGPPPPYQERMVNRAIEPPDTARVAPWEEQRG